MKLDDGQLEAVVQFEQMCANGQTAEAVDYMLDKVGAEVILLLIARVISLQKTGAYGTVDAVLVPLEAKPVSP